MPKFYGSVKMLAGADSYTVESYSGRPTAISNVDLSTFVGWLNQQAGYLEFINNDAGDDSEEVVILLETSRVLNNFGAIMSARKGGASTALYSETATSYSRLADAVYVTTGIALSSAGETNAQTGTLVALSGATYERLSKEVLKLYSSVNGLAITGAAPNTSATHITAVDLGTFRKNITARYALDAGTRVLSQFRVISSGDGTFFNTKAIYEGFDGKQRQMTLAQLTSWGITVTNPELYWEEDIDITVTSIPHAEEITKLYGSVDGLTKLIYSNF